MKKCPQLVRLSRVFKNGIINLLFLI
uniref:Uncharacterized protein n=1 Tax=Heterorhabditis bacteriophora TaxID=37862 RepID=A0A1I7WZ07_HETBA